MQESPFNIIYPELPTEKIFLSRGEYYENSADGLPYIRKGTVWDESQRLLVEHRSFVTGPQRFVALTDTEIVILGNFRQNLVLNFLVAYPSVTRLVHLWIEAGYNRRKIEAILSDLTLKLSHHPISSEPKTQFLEIMSLVEVLDQEVTLRTVVPLEPKVGAFKFSSLKKILRFLPQTLGLGFFVGFSGLVLLLSQRLLFSSQDLVITAKDFWLWMAVVCGLNLVCKFALFTVSANKILDKLTKSFKQLISRMITSSRHDLTLGRVVALMMIIRQTLNYRDLILPSTLVTLMGALGLAAIYTPDFRLFLFSWTILVCGIFLLIDQLCQVRYAKLSASRTMIDVSHFKTDQAQNIKKWLDSRFEFSCFQNAYYSLQNQLTGLGLIVFFIFRWKHSAHLGIEIVLFQTVNLSIGQIFKKYPILRSVFRELTNASFFENEGPSPQTVDLSKNWNGENFVFECLFTSELSLQETHVIYSKKIYAVSFSSLNQASVYFNYLAGIKMASTFRISSGDSSWDSNREFSPNVSYFSPELRLVPGTIQENILSASVSDQRIKETLELLGLDKIFLELNLSLQSVITENTFIPFSVIARILIARAFLDNRSHIWIFSKIEECVNPELWEIIRQKAESDAKIVLISGTDERYLAHADEYLFFDDHFHLAQGTFLSLGRDIGINFFKRFNHA